MAQREFSRATGTPPVDGNSIQLLDASENYTAWFGGDLRATRLRLLRIVIGKSQHGGTPVPKFFLALVILAAALLALVIAPVADELVVAAVFAGVLWPAMQRLRGKRGIAAGLITLTVLLLLLGPVATMLTYVVVRDGADAAHFISNAARSEDVAALVDWLPESARNMIENAIDRVPRNIDELMSAMEGHKGEAISTVRRAISGRPTRKCKHPS